MNPLRKFMGVDSCPMFTLIIISKIYPYFVGDALAILTGGVVLFSISGFTFNNNNT